MWCKTIDFNLKQLFGQKGMFINILFVCLSHQEKINQLKASQIPRTFILT